MKILWNWLLELCDFDRLPTAKEGAEALTRGGIEVETLAHLAREISGVVVAQVVAKRPHPQSDKLTLVQVITAAGGPATEVVCGAPNVPAPGRKVIWAQVGGTLPGGVALAPKAIKGVVSPGMLCSETELGIGDDDDGIIVLAEDETAPLGVLATGVLGIDDWLFDLSTHANRGDLLGHLGVARELCALLGGRLVWPNLALDEHTAGEPLVLPVTIEDAADCPRYTARAIDHLTVAPSPRLLRQRLRNLGARPVSNLVDVTNLVMFELGQPLHAFDADKLRHGAISVRAARPGEALVTLDDVRRELTGTDLLICDGDEPVALAGVMGGQGSEVSGTTRRVLLEAASFHSTKVRRTGRRLGLSSEAAQRFERGVDPELAALASARAARLLCSLGGGTVRPGLAEAYPGRREAAPIALRTRRACQISGIALTTEDCQRSLAALGFSAVPTGDGLSVTPPSARADVVREIDVIEEVIRIHGYERVPATLPALRQAPRGVGDGQLARGDLVRAALAGAGMAEAITFGFCSRERLAALGLPATDRRASPIALRNPMSADQAVMRTSLLPNLLAAVARNASFGHRDLALFEVGSVFLRRGALGEAEPGELADEPLQVAGVVTGARAAQLGRGAAYDVFDAKELATVAVAAIAGAEAAARLATVAESAISYLHPGVCGELRLADTLIGCFGEVHPRTRRALGLDEPAFAFEIDLAALALAAPARMRPIAKFPGATRDISLLMDAAIPAAAVAAAIAAVPQPLVVAVRVLEDYRDARLGDGKKSMLWSIDYRSPERTLTDAEIDAAHEAIVAHVVAALPAQRR